MCTSIQEARNRAELAVRLADTLASRGVGADEAERLGEQANGRRLYAQIAYCLAHPQLGDAKLRRQVEQVRTPSLETWAMVGVLLRHREIAANVESLAVGS